MVCDRSVPFRLTFFIPLLAFLLTVSHGLSPDSKSNAKHASKQKPTKYTSGGHAKKASGSHSKSPKKNLGSHSVPIKQGSHSVPIKHGTPKKSVNHSHANQHDSHVAKTGLDTNLALKEGAPVKIVNQSQDGSILRKSENKIENGTPKQIENRTDDGLPQKSENQTSDGSRNEDQSKIIIDGEGIDDLVNADGPDDLNELLDADGPDDLELVNADGTPDLSLNESQNTSHLEDTGMPDPPVNRSQNSSKTTPDNFMGGRQTEDMPCIQKKAFEELEDKVQMAEQDLLEDTERMKINEKDMMQDEQSAHNLVQEAQKQLDEARKSFEAEQHQLLKVAARWKKNATALFAENQDMARKVDTLLQERSRLRQEQDAADKQRAVTQRSQARRGGQSRKASQGGMHTWQKDKKATEYIQKTMVEMQKWKEHATQLEADKKKLEQTALKYFNEKEHYQKESRQLLGEVKEHVGEMHKNDLSDQAQIKALSIDKQKLKSQLEESKRELAYTGQAKQQLEQALAGTQSKLQESIASVGKITQEQLEKDAHIQAAVYAEVERLKTGSKQLEGEKEQYKGFAEKLNSEKQQLQKTEAILIGQLQQAMAKVAADKNQLQEMVSKTMAQQIVAKYEDEKRHLQEEVARISKDAMDSKLKAQALGATLQQWKSSTEKLQGERQQLQMHITSLADEKNKNEVNQATIERRLQESAEKVGRITSDTMKRNSEATNMARQQMEGLIGANTQLKATVSQLTQQLEEMQRSKASVQAKLHEANMKLAGQAIASQDESTKSWMQKLVVNAEKWKSTARQLRGENEQLRQAVQHESAEAEGWKSKGAEAAHALDTEKQASEADKLQVAQQLKDAIVGVAEITEKKLKEGMQAAGITDLHSKRLMQDRLLVELQSVLTKLTGSPNL